jgi:hypothetical protein
MESEPIKNDARANRRREALGPNAVCVVCGYVDPAGLVAGGRSLLEHHHIVGRYVDDGLTGTVCRNCHGEITEGLRTAGVPMAAQPSLLERLIVWLRAFGMFLVHAGQRIIALAEQVARFLLALEGRMPTWRELPEAA